MRCDAPMPPNRDKVPCSLFLFLSVSLSHVCSVDGVLYSVSGKVPSLCWQPGPALQAQRVSAGPWTCNPKCPWHLYTTEYCVETRLSLIFHG
ncbi:hypothetical protein CPAR01_02543 [Colletotrichum paranaense]|uniref:Secreted protein n=2 Tax=Colletotrichum acutatum species complex TaxID=2707335 RepID=A0AAI9UMS2_9PEZI|nr:uncharacterized protein CPAR01_02543 [Colletotrichum paranaense]KAK1460247.1 hypothetical protein CMEL01_03246 [Colletotrichum melonis]KAK1545041.1 hypothetical protein CPAR01_02543 [Colletotrichum paranaense]